jgi:hypothetical protein
MSDPIMTFCLEKNCGRPTQVVPSINSALGYGRAPPTWGPHCSPPDVASRAVSWGGGSDEGHIVQCAVHKTWIDDKKFVEIIDQQGTDLVPPPPVLAIPPVLAAPPPAA